MINKRSSILGEYRKLVNAYPPEESLFLNFNGYKVQVSSNSSELLKALRHYFSEFLSTSRGILAVIMALEAPPPRLAAEDLKVIKTEPSEKKPEEEYFDIRDGRIVRERLTGMVFLFNESLHLVIGPVLENANLVIDFINNRYIEETLNQGALYGRAAAVNWMGRGLVLVGFPGMGKSTLALKLLSLGVRFLSDGRIMFRKHRNFARLYGVARQPRVTPDGLLQNPSLKSFFDSVQHEECSGLDPKGFWDSEEKRDVLIHQAFGARKFVLEARMDLLVILNWKRGNEPFSISRVGERDRTDLLKPLMKEPGLFYLPKRGAPMARVNPNLYVKELESVAMIELSGGVDLEKGANCCMRFLERGELPEPVQPKT